MMEQSSLLDRIDAAQVEHTKLISLYDEQVCQALQADHRRFLGFASAFSHFAHEHGDDFHSVGVNPMWHNPDAMLTEITKQIASATEHFINRIVWHFRDSYHVSIDSGSIVKKYDEAVTYEDVVREIVEQLGGLNFEEKSFKELRDDFYNLVKKYGGNIPIKRINNKLTFDELFFWDTRYTTRKDEAYPESGGQRYRFFQTLSHFETGSKEVLDAFDELCRYGCRHDWFEKREYGHLNKIKGVKFYKNGKVEVTFASQELACEFALRYLGKEV